MQEEIAGHRLDMVFRLLEGRLMRNGAPPVRLVVCGGAALIATGLLSRATRDVDVVALMDDNRKLIAPVPMPEHVLIASGEVAQALNLPKDWLNNAPSRDEGGLFQMGLPSGFQERLQAREYGSRLTVYFAGRIDQIHFKLYAAVDRGGYHIADLEALNPATEELIQAARWTLTHDVSKEFEVLLKELLERLGYGNAVKSM